MRDTKRYIPSVFENKISATDLKKIQAGIRSAQVEAIRDVAYSIESVEFTQRWIPVEEELPEDEHINNKNEVKDENGIVQSAWYNHSHKLWISLVSKNHIFPTHWRPIEYK